MSRKINSLFGVCLLTTLLISSPSPSLADVHQDVAALMEQVRKHEIVDDRNVLNSPPLEVIAELGKYRNDPSEDVQLAVSGSTIDIALHSKKTPVLQEAVHSILVTAMQKPSTSTTRNAVSSLLIFSRVAFSDKARQDNRKLLMQATPEPAVLLLTGISEDKSAVNRLREFSKEPLDTSIIGWWGGRTWAAHLALARLGDQTEIQFCIATYQSIKDDVLRVTRLLKDLDYIRQPETVKVLIRALLSDRVLPGSPPDVPDSPFASRALILLAASIENFPQSNPEKDSEKENSWRDRARAWLKVNQGHLKIKR